MYDLSIFIDNGHWFRSNSLPHNMHQYVFKHVYRIYVYDYPDALSKKHNLSLPAIYWPNVSLFLVSSSASSMVILSHSNFSSTQW